MMIFQTNLWNAKCLRLDVQCVVCCVQRPLHIVKGVVCKVKCGVASACRSSYFGHYSIHQYTRSWVSSSLTAKIGPYFFVMSICDRLWLTTCNIFGFLYIVYKISQKCHLQNKFSISVERARKVWKGKF